MRRLLGLNHDVAHIPEVWTTWVYAGIQYRVVRGELFFRHRGHSDWHLAPVPSGTAY
jgi:hypothetical protein